MKMSRNTKLMMRKCAAATLGFFAGVVAMPLFAVAWPFVMAWFMWNEQDGDAEVFA